MTKLHSVNISAIWYGVKPSSCLPRSASPTSNTPTPAETMKVRMSSFGTSHTVLSAAAAVGFFDRSWPPPPGTANATAEATSKASSAVAASGIATDPAGMARVKKFAAKRVTNTPSIGPSRKPAMPAMLTNASRRARPCSVIVKLPITAAATGVTAEANMPLKNRSA